MGLLLYSVTCLIFLLLLLIIYFTRKRIDSIENRIFSFIMVSNAIGLIIEICCYFTVKHNEIVPILNTIVTKLLLVYYLLYISLFTMYVYIISHSSKNDSEDENEYNKMIIRNCLIYFVFNSFITCMLPMEYSNEGSHIYSYGLSINYMYVVYSILIVSWIYVLFKNIKKVKSKKYIPIFILIVLGTVVGIIQHLYPFLTLMTGLDAIITFIMCFTIENPDVKMLEQVELAKEAADKANRAKTDFLSSMSHEIRTPLNAIVGFSDCIMDSNTLGEAKENAHDIINASQTLLEIVNGILDISKIEAGKIEIVNSKYNALDTFEELAKLITPKMNEKGLDFTYKIAPDLPKTLFGDHANIKKVVTNLLSNACKYTEHGFVHYEVNCINTKDVCKLIISVEDSGRGIKKDSIDKLFTKFQRLDEDKNTTIEGTGLGLAITKQLIELMGGKIIVHTVYGEGSKFTVVLNQKITTEEVTNKKKVKDTLDLHDIRILMVDDTPLNLKVTCKLLERYHANHIVTCDNGFECIDRIKRGEQYDIILLDDMMPKMSGVETLKILKEIPGFSIPTIALTANAITGMREKYIRDGFDDYLAKPIEKDQLIQVINQILGRSVTEDISIPVNTEETPNIRGEVIPNVEDYDSAEQDRIKNQIIPVEDNIEMILGDQLDRNYHEEEAKLNDIPIELHHFDDHEDEFVSAEEVFDKNYLIEHGVDIEEALSLLGDMDMYNMTIHDFYQDVEDKWNNIVHYKDEGNMSEYSILVHSLKSDCKYLGFMKLADISYQHELKSKENDLDFVLAHFKELEDEYHKSMEIIKNYVEHNPINE